MSFSALSNELGDDRIGDLVEIFETRATDVVTHQGGRVIKTLGDSVLFVSEDADAAMDIAHGIIDVIGADSRMPDVRLGLATGSVILRFGDVFGPPVNLAARLTGIARRNRVITDGATAAQLLRQPLRDPRAHRAPGARLRCRSSRSRSAGWRADYARITPVSAMGYRGVVQFGQSWGSHLMSVLSQ